MILMRMFLAILAGILAVSCATTSTPVNSDAEFPKYRDLSASNVALKMTGYEFISGIDEQGQTVCNGIDVKPVSWWGSGFIVREDGTVITNFHVADKALEGEAAFDDGSTYKITQIKVYDPVHDLAVLKIKSNETFPAVTLGNSDTVQTMDKVLAVGNPMGQGLNVTEGKISQVVRNDANDRIMLRHTSPITGGNSGGALYRGQEVIGINVATWPSTQFHMAVPINFIKPLLVKKYDRETLLQDVFAPTKANFKQRRTQIHATDGVVGGGDIFNPGLETISFVINPLDDLYFDIKSDHEGDILVFLIDQEGNPLGCGDLAGLLFSSESLMGSVNIVVVNLNPEPVRYGLNIYSIVW